MKLTPVFLLLWLLASNTIIAQNIGIGTPSPNASAVLDVSSHNKGLLVPRIFLASLTDAATITNPATGLLVYNTNTGIGTGFYYNSGTPASPSWTQLVVSVAATGWALGGNSGTNPAANFIGTIDDRPLQLRVNNQSSGLIDSTRKLSFWGFGAGKLNTGTFNTAIGYKSFSANTAGSFNTAGGSNSLAANTIGIRNTAFGTNTLEANTTGDNNVAVGSSALNDMTDGTSNTAIGSNALQGMLTGSYNVAVGGFTLFENQGADGNTAIGYEAMRENVQGEFNVAVGRQALRANVGSYSNTAVGAEALMNSVAGRNTGVGSQALRSNTSGEGNTALGDDALYANTTGSSLVAVGSLALTSNTTGSDNVAVGYAALTFNETGNSNTAVGIRALWNNRTGTGNTAVGERAMHTNNTGGNNTAIGRWALNANAAGDGNTAAGAFALGDNTSGNYNTAYGQHALEDNSIGIGNTGVGYRTGRFGNDNERCSFFGYEAEAAFDDYYENATALGAESRIWASNQVRIGNSNVTSIGGFANWSNVSDARFKKDINSNVPGLDFILRLQPVTYHLDVPAINKQLNVTTGKSPANSILYSGFIAQDVEKAAALSGYDFSGVDKPANANDFYSLRYADFVVPMVKGMQEQQQQIETLKSEIAELKRAIELLKETKRP